jgi:hypothetical protein
MPNEGQQRHDRMVRLFRGEFGDDIYGSAVLAGARRRETTSLKAYVGLGADRKLYFIAVTPTRLTLESSLARVKRLRMNEDDIAQQHTQVKQVRPGGNPADVDELLWTMAGARTVPLGLPLAFVTFLATLEGDQKIVLWHSRMVPGDWMLKQIQSKIR